MKKFWIYNLILSLSLLALILSANSVFSEGISEVVFSIILLIISVAQIGVSLLYIFKNRKKHTPTTKVLAIFATGVMFIVILSIFSILFWDTDTGTFRKFSNIPNEIGLNIQDSIAQEPAAVLLKKDTITIDSTIIIDRKAEIHKKYTVKQLNLLMDTLNERMVSSHIRYNAPLFYVDEFSNRISVNLINYDEKHIDDFKKHISDSPAITFVKSGSGRMKGDFCDSCGIEMFATTPIYRLPIDKIKVEIINNTESEIMAGEDYFLEIWDENSWQEVCLNYFFNSLGHIIWAKDNRTFDIDLQPETHTYKVGKYRVSKSVNINNKRYILEADFILE